MNTTGLNIIDWLTLVFFFASWIGYNLMARHRAKRRPRLQNLLHDHIHDWIDVLHHRHLRIVDTSIIANMERNSTFFASSSLLIIAGLLTAVGSSDAAIDFLEHVSFGLPVSQARWEFGIVVMVVCFVYAFFTFSWTMRQWGMASFLIGSAPENDDLNATTTQRQTHKRGLSRMVWLAIYNFNLGLRAFYFSLAFFAWFIYPPALIVTTVWVIGVLYRREFHSRTLKALILGLPDSPDRKRRTKFDTEL